MESSTSMLDRLKESKVFKVVSGYALVAFITVQIASLVSDSFGFGQEFMQNIIIVFLVILPFIALIPCFLKIDIREQFSMSVVLFQRTLP